MKAIDISRSLNYLDDDIIAEAMTLRDANAARKKPRLARYIAAVLSCAAVIAAAVLIGVRGSRDMPVRPPDSGDVTVSPDVTVTDGQPTTQITTAEPPVTTVSETNLSDTSTEPDVTDEALPIGGGDYTFERKYVEEVENLYIAYQIVGQEARDEWVNNVYLKTSSEEMNELPALYRIIHDLNISKEDFIEENKNYVDYPGMYYSEEVIEALYLDDIKEMKKRLVNPTALYYEGEIYTFNGLIQKPELTDNIPDDVLAEYLDFIYDVAEQIGEIKYMQDDINMLRDCID